VFCQSLVNYKLILYYLKMFGRLHEVTKSVKLVAFTKFKKIQYRIKMHNESLISIRKFAVAIKGRIKSYLIIPLTSDKGCCGSINTHLLSALDVYINTVCSISKKSSIALIGKKGLLFIKQKYKQQYIRYVQDIFNTTISIISTLKISEDILKLIFDKYVFIFNHFVTITEQKVYLFEIASKSKILYSIQNIISGFMDTTTFWSIFYFKHFFNANFFEDLYYFIVSIVLLHSLFDHEVSELGGRITSMEKSSQNALEMHDTLQIQYNKARQSYITNQLVEICSATIAINSMRSTI